MVYTYSIYYILLVSRFYFLTKLITSELQNLLDSEVIYKKMSFAHNPYGDGEASKRICE